MKRFFIAGTGTGVGKTLVTAALAAQLRAQGRGVLALKPVISGFDADNIAATDTGLLLAAQGLPPEGSHADRISPWRFAAPLSPDMAAEDENLGIDFDALVTFCGKAGGETVLIEGAGGVMTPLGGKHTILDVIKALDAAVILVTGSYLGSLSHALTACEVIRAAGLTLQAIIISDSPDAPVSPERMRETLRRYLPHPIALISRLDSSPRLWENVPDLTFMLP